MNPLTAAALFTLGIALLFVLDRRATRRMSMWVLLPYLWLCIGSSRVVSSWMNPAEQVDVAVSYMEGNSLDRNIQALLMGLGIVALSRRRVAVAKLLRANRALVLFFLYCLASVAWSDFPAVSIRRWVKAVGDLLMVLVLVSDDDSSAALRLPARVGFVLVPVSILLIKYFPDLARSFDAITGEPEFTGVATSKNGLGMVAMLFGLASAGRFGQTWRESGGDGRAGPLIAHGLLVAMAVGLFFWAHSMTSMICFVLSLVLLVVSGRSPTLPRRWGMHVLTAALLIGAFGVLLLGAGGGILSAIGRDATLTGRTAIWERALGMVQDPALGTGFEAFWLGPRFDAMHSAYRGINQAHNGYIEVYLNLGWVGVGLLAALLFSSYRKVCARLRNEVGAGGFWYAYFFAVLVVNFTEAHFKTMSPVWVLFLVGTLAAPGVEVAPSRAKAGRQHLSRGRPAVVLPHRRAAGWAPAPRAGQTAGVRKAGPDSTLPWRPWYRS